MSAELLEHVDARAIPSRGEQMLVPTLVRRLFSRFPAASHGLLSLTNQAIVSATSFATVVIIGRATSPEQLGLYYLIASVVVITVSIEDQIVGAPYTIYSKRYRDRELESYAGSVWCHHFILTALSVAVLFVTIMGLSLAGAVNIVPGLWALLIAGPFLLLREWIRRYAYANLQIIPAVALDTIVAVLQLGGLLLLWHLQLLSIFTIFATMGIACAIACIWWYAIAKPKVRLEPRRYLPDWTQNWSFGRWALQSYIAGNTSPYFMSWILGLAVNTAAVGVFGAFITLMNIPNLFLISMDRILTPRSAQAFAHGGCEELRRVLMLAAAVLLPILGLFCLVVFAMGSRLAVFVYGPQYEGHAATLSALAVVMFMNGVGMIVGNGLWAIDQPRINFAADVATLVVTFASAALLVSPFGVLGAALALLIGTTTGCIVRTIRLQRALNFLPAPNEVSVQ